MTPRLLREPTEELLDRLALADRPATLALVVVRGGHHAQRISGIADRLSTSEDAWRRAAGELLRGYVSSELSDGAVAKAEGHFARAARDFRELGDHVGATYALTFLSISQSSHGDNTTALESITEAMAMGVHVPTLLQVQAAQTRARVGDVGGARQVLERAARTTVADDSVSLARIRNALAEIARLDGRLDDALVWHHAAMELDTTGAPDQFLALLRTNYAQTLAATGQHDEAGRQHEIAVERVMRTKDAPARAAVLAAQAQWCERGGDHERAAALRARAGELRG